MDFERIRHIIGKLYMEKQRDLLATRARVASMGVSDRGVLFSLQMAEQQAAGACEGLKRAYAKIFGEVITDYAKDYGPKPKEAPAGAASSGPV